MESVVLLEKRLWYEGFMKQVYRFRSGSEKVW